LQLFTNEHGIALGGSLKGNTHLKKLHLVNCHLKDTAASALSEGLEHNKTLELLNLESNFITGVGLIALAKAIESSQTLTEIKVSNQVGYHSHAVIFRILCLFTRDYYAPKRGCG
jgi:Ran GTPase-activating protein (RanGAP) involved in mRNA processing and transport